MTDAEKPAFPVVDRRSAAQATQTTPASTATEAVSSHATSSDSGIDPAFQNASAETNTFPSTEDPNTKTEDSMPQTASDTDTEESQDADRREEAMAMPAPAELLAYVATQMDVKTLAGTLLGVFSTQAWRAMGLIANPLTGQTEQNLPEAQIAIDCVQFLLGKIENELPEAERREMHRRLNDLRMNYLTKRREG